MSSRPFLPPNVLNPIVNSVSMASNITSPATIIQMLPGICYQVIWTGVPVGTFKIQVSNNYQQGPNQSVINAGTWEDLPSSSFTGTYPIPSGSAGDGMLDLVGCNAYASRLVYTASSGTGNLTVIPCSKVL